MCKINGKKLGELRVEAGISQEKLATLIGSSRVNISNYERGVSEPPEEIVDKICIILKINKDDVAIHDVGYSFMDRTGKTENKLRQRKDFVRLMTPIETEKWISKRREFTEEEEKNEVSVALKSAFGIGSKKYILINPTLIHIPEWQRDTDMAKAGEISQNFNEDKLDPIKAYLLNGKLYVADGAHRVVAIIINGELKILVEILKCDEREAVLTFLGQGTGRKSMTVNDTYRAGIKANIEEYVKFKYLFCENNIQITAEIAKLDNPIGNIRPSSEILRMVNRENETITSIINLVKKLDWCGADKNVFTLRIFKVIKKLYAAYGKENAERKMLKYCKGATYYESKIAPVKSNSELFDILVMDINK